LHNDPSGAITAAGASGNLGNELKGAFWSTEVRQHQTGIYGNNTNQRDIGKIMPFGNHLCPNEDVEAAGGKIVKNALESTTPPRRIAVETRNGQGGKQFAQASFELLCPFADVSNAFAMALWAAAGWWNCMATVMAS
jgi:hypothetical protein